MEKQLLYSVEDVAGEKRCIELYEEDGVAEILEHSSGPYTEMVFGDESHASVLRLDAAAQHSLVTYLGGNELVGALRRFYSAEEEMYLSDIQDALDRLGAPYARASYCPGGASYRPPYYG